MFYAYGRAQNILLKIQTPPENSKLPIPDHKKSFQSREAALKELSLVLRHFQSQGYLLASAEINQNDSSHISATIEPGNLFSTASLRMGNLNPAVASRLGISERLYVNKPFRYNEVIKAFERIIVYYENNGYPFAVVNLDSVIVNNDRISAALNIEKNKFFKIDSIKITGDAKINQGFIYRYLSLKPGMAYNEELIASCFQKLTQLPFVSQSMGPVSRLTEKTNKLILFLDKKNASQFDGIIGVLPDADTKKTILTGDVKLKVVNGVFRNGETFDLEWRRLKSQTLDFNGRIIYPFIFGTPVGADYNIKIYRRDTTFIDVNNNLGLQYYFKGLNNIKVFYKQRSTNLISTSGYSLATTLPDYADIVTQSYGLGLLYEKLDYRFNPRNGFQVNVSGQTGNRIIKKNPNINELAYENLLLRSTQYQAEGNAALFIPVYRNNILKLGMQGATVFGNSTVYRNELFRIGGLKTLRGFDEESIFASTYVIPTVEYRFLFSQNSHLLLFAEGAWYENNSNHSYMKDTPMSFGAGINFETRAGILSLNYGVGNQLGNGFDFRSGKIHFGLTALF